MNTPLRRFRELGQRALWFATDLLFDAGLGGGLHRQRAGARILLYHAIDRRGSTRLNSRSTSRLELERHLAYFASSCEVVPLTDLLAGRRAADRLTVALTFDDGHANHLELALPLLDRFRLPATFLVPGSLAEGVAILWPDAVDLASTALEAGGEIEVAGDRYRSDRKRGLVSVTTGGRLADRCRRARWPEIEAVLSALEPLLERPGLEAARRAWRPLAPAELRGLAGAGRVTIGAHGHHHTDLCLLPRVEAVEELARSKRALESLLDRDVDILAYPFGSYSPELVSAAEQLGYRWQLVLQFARREDRDDVRLAERMGVNPFVSWDNQLWSILRGRY